MNLITILLTTVKAKVSPFLTKVKMWLTPSYLKNQVLVKLRSFFTKILDVRPKDENDYYAIGPWLMSKKLAFAVVIVTGMLCASYIWMSKPQSVGSNNPYKSYKYNSLALKFTTDKVSILGKSGYTAYVGDVEKGQVKGSGKLYDKDGKLVYTGAFDANAFNGVGRLYYDNESLKYNGEFEDNVFAGEGKLYREDGTLEYDGSFAAGMKDGDGKLYNGGENLIYTGSFQKDEIMYRELIGKKSSEVTAIYSGKRRIYNCGEDYCITMPEIGATYCSTNGENTLDEEWTVSGVYILKSSILLNGVLVEQIEDLTAVLGEPVYKGNTALTVQDAIAVNEGIELLDSADTEFLSGAVKMNTTDVFDDVITVNSFDNHYLAYIYMYQQDNITYTFFCRDKGGAFSFYLMSE